MSKTQREAENNWVPLEANPEVDKYRSYAFTSKVLTNYLHLLGGSSAWGFVDIYGLDAELLAMLPSPVLAFIFLFPVTEKYEEFRKEEELKLQKSSQIVSKELWYTKQTIGNSCGTIALFHALANNLNNVTLEKGPLSEFFERTRNMTPEQRAKDLELDINLKQAHQNFATLGQTEAPDAQDDVDLHFVCIVHKDGYIYELDGRKCRPINHGKSSPETFISDAAKVAQTFMSREESLNFSLIGLAPVQTD